MRDEKCEFDKSALKHAQNKFFSYMLFLPVCEHHPLNLFSMLPWEEVKIVCVTEFLYIIEDMQTVLVLFVFLVAIIIVYSTGNV